MNEERQHSSTNLKEGNSNSDQQEHNNQQQQKVLTKQASISKQDEIQLGSNSEKQFYLHKLKKKINLNISIPTQQKNQDYAELTNGTLLNIVLDKDGVKNLDQQHLQNKESSERNSSKINGEQSLKNGQEVQGSLVGSIQRNNQGIPSSQQLHSSINSQSGSIQNSGNTYKINNKQQQGIERSNINQVNAANNNNSHKNTEDQFKEINVNRDNNTAENQYIEVNNSRLQISELRRVKVLGHGSSGLVEKAVHDSTGIVIGIKVILQKYDNKQFQSCNNQNIPELIIIISGKCFKVTKRGTFTLREYLI